MSFLYPNLLWFCIPLLILLMKRERTIVVKVHGLVLLLLVITLSRPIFKESLQETSIDAKDIIIALDVSFSMRATDLSPTRYDFAKETIKSLLKKNPSDNIMLIAFTANPLLLSPPTTDHALIAVALETLNPEFILTKGTSLEKLFKKLHRINKGHKNLILITDGGEESDVEVLSSLLQNSHVSLITLALGSTKGSTVEKKDATLLKDQEGNLVISRINPLLKTLTSSVDGIYIKASLSPSLTAIALEDALRSQKSHRQNVQKMQHRYQELYQIPLFFAALLFLLVHTRAVKYLLIFFTLLGFHAQASMIDGYHLQQAYKAYGVADFNLSQKHLKTIKKRSLQSQMTLANTYYKTHSFKKAIKVYKSILSTSAPIKQQLYYNIANTYTLQGTYTKAKLYYTKALQLGFDEDAQFNLKLISTLKDKNTADVGIAHPKSQSSASSQSESQDKKKAQEEDQPSSGSGGSGENKANEEKKKNKLLDDKTPQKQPLGSKVYELINKGYTRETQPW